MIRKPDARRFALRRFSKARAHGTALAGLAACLVLMGGGPRAVAAPEGGQIAQSVSVGDRELDLAACAYREFLRSQLYAVGLYLPQSVEGSEAVFSEDLPKALQIRITYGGSVPEDVPDEWRDAFRRHAGAEIRGDVREAYGDLVSGDRLTIRYAPGQGTTITINGERVVTAEDHGLMRSFLEIWMGENPVSENIKSMFVTRTCR